VTLSKGSLCFHGRCTTAAVRALRSILPCLAFLCAFASAQDAPRVVHVFVALADNAHQGIVPVPARLGNGDDPEHNLYWGAGYGVKTFFARSGEWRLEASQMRPRPAVLERCVFRHRTKNVLLIADAYQGSQIRQAIVDFLKAAGGESRQSAGNAENAALQQANPTALPDRADLVVYVGHEGLMDFSLPTLPHKDKKDAREAIVLACISKSYFAEPLRAAGAKPLLLTRLLMAPEAYPLKSALDGWVLGERAEQIRERAAAAYSKYQHCSLAAAKRLLVTGF
jgi:hypothetical protein